MGITRLLGATRYDADVFYKAGLESFQKKNFDLAMENLDKAIAVLPNHAEYHAARGLVHLQDGVNEKAQADFEQALRLYSLELLAHYGLGVLAYRARKWEDAQARFMEAYFIQPDRPEVLYYLALSHHRQQQNVPALNYMQQAQQAFEQANDKRRTDASRWVKELQKLVMAE